MATLKDISAELGLSVATVSRALNGFPEVNARTRDRVQATADRLGYRPNRIAQRLVTGRSGMVGMILKIKPDMSADQTFFEMITRLTNELAQRDADLVLAVDQGDGLSAYDRLLERDILDGFILNAPVPGDPRIRFLQERGIPFVLHGEPIGDTPHAYYSIDNCAVSEDAVDLLTALGHRRIAFINGDLGHAYAVDRRKGFLAGIAANGLSVPGAFVTDGEPTDSYGYRMALDMLAGRRGAAPTAFVCASTLVALGVMRAVRDRGLRVPQDVSIVAHDDALPQTRAISFDPALTVTRAPLRDACAPLAQMILDRVAGVPLDELQRLTRAELIVRDSTGPVPDKGGSPWP